MFIVQILHTVLNRRIVLTEYNWQLPSFERKNYVFLKDYITVQAVGTQLINTLEMQP